MASGERLRYRAVPPRDSPTSCGVVFNSRSISFEAFVTADLSDEVCQISVSFRSAEGRQQTVYFIRGPNPVGFPRDSGPQFHSTSHPTLRLNTDNCRKLAVHDDLGIRV